MGLCRAPRERVYTKATDLGPPKLPASVHDALTHIPPHPSREEGGFFSRYDEQVQAQSSHRCGELGPEQGPPALLSAHRPPLASLSPCLTQDLRHQAVCKDMNCCGELGLWSDALPRLQASSVTVSAPAQDNQGQWREGNMCSEDTGCISTHFHNPKFPKSRKHPHTRT